MKTPLRILACLAALSAASAAFAADWTENYTAALTQAKKEHKMLLLNFTGSDWCPWCKRIDAEVFDTPKFKEFADKGLVLVTVDFPNAKPQSDTVKAQNSKLQEKYGIQAYPTLIVLDSNEKVVFVQEGYKPGGADAFIGEFPKPSTGG
jgi:thioredoxin-related protein